MEDQPSKGDFTKFLDLPKGTRKKKFPSFSSYRKSKRQDWISPLAKTSEIPSKSDATAFIQ